MTISERIADNWPVTEATLSSEVTGYGAIKLRAIARATRELYGSAVAEADVPDGALQWIADKATVYLIPVGIDYYADQYRKSDSKDGMTVTYYDRVEQLKSLRSELEADCLSTLKAVLDEIDSPSAPESVPSVPAVSTEGLLVDPTARAHERGVYWG